jgi:hypothetical protein
VSCEFLRGVVPAGNCALRLREGELERGRIMAGASTEATFEAQSWRGSGTRRSDGYVCNFAVDWPQQAYQSSSWEFLKLEMRRHTDAQADHRPSSERNRIS